MIITKLKYEVFKLVTETISLILFFFIIFFVFKTRNHKVGGNVFITDLLQNWNSHAIEDVYISPNGTCDSYFLHREWEGIEASCDCRMSYYFSVKSQIHRGRCNFVELAVGCRVIRTIPPQMAVKWKGSVLCTVPHASNFFEILPSVDKCPDDYNLCGVDTRNFNLCYPMKNNKNFKCPINDMKILVNSNTKMKNKFQTLKLNEDWSLFYSNNSTNQSLFVDIKYSEGKVCLNPIEYNIKGNYLKYSSNEDTNGINISANCKTRIADFNFDDRYKSFDSNSKFKFYTENDILNKIEALPQLDSQQLISYNSYLNSRSYIHWSPYCNKENNLDPRTIIEDLDQLSSLDDVFDFLRFYFVGIAVFYLVVLPLSHYIDNKQIWGILMLFLILIMASFILLTFMTINITKHKSKLSHKFISIKCGDYYTNTSFASIGHNINDLLITSYQILLFGIILFFIVLFKHILTKTSLH